jgi:plasmid stability protein
MTDPVTLNVDIDELLHRALVLRAAKEGRSVAAVVNRLLLQALTAELDEVTGRPPLAEVIQKHHDRELRGEGQGPPTASLS